LPSAGFCLLAALGWTWLVRHIGRSERQRTLAFGLLAVVVAAFAIRTVVRNQDWKDNHALYASGVIAAPASAKMHDFMGNMYMANGQFDLARGELQTAMGIYPDYLDALESYGLLEFEQGHYQVAGGMLEKALYRTGRYNKNYDFMAVNLAAFYMQTDHIDGALDLLNQEISQSPKYARAWSNRAVIHYKRGEAAAARADAEAALGLDGSNSQAQAVMRLLSAPSSPAPAK
jgi:Tfp pilus assembly protein PilF